MLMLVVISALTRNRNVALLIIKPCLDFYLQFKWYDIMIVGSVYSWSVVHDNTPAECEMPNRL